MSLLTLVSPRRAETRPTTPQHWTLFAEAKEALRRRFAFNFEAERITERSASATFEAAGRRYLIMITEA